jgi:hypothetical protein
MTLMAHVIRPDFGETRLDALQRHSFGYFLNETNSANGLVADRTQPGAPASIAGVGFALAAYPIGIERAWMTRADAIERTLALLRFFWTSPQGTAPGMTGYKNASEFAQHPCVGCSERARWRLVEDPVGCNGDGFELPQTRMPTCDEWCHVGLYSTIEPLQGAEQRLNVHAAV